MGIFHSRLIICEISKCSNMCGLCSDVVSERTLISEESRLESIRFDTTTYRYKCWVWYNRQLDATEKWFLEAYEGKGGQ